MKAGSCSARHYLQAWHASRLLLGGYARGADVLPFMVTRLRLICAPAPRVVALLGLSHHAGVEFHFADLLGGRARDGWATVPEIRRLTGLRFCASTGRRKPTPPAAISRLG